MTTGITFDELRLECSSWAGDSTWLRVRPPGVAIDVGRGSTRLAGVDQVFLTHGHMDHALGLPFLLSMRIGPERPPLQIHCPAEICGQLEAFLDAAAALDGRQVAYEIHGLEAGDRVVVGDDMWIEAFATDHVVPALGYHLVRLRRRLRSELSAAEPARIAALRRAGERVEDAYEELWMSCTGDTSAEVFERCPELFGSRVLVVECTFLGDGHEERARRFKHIHLEDLVGLRERFTNDALVLYHLSRRHRPDELRAAARRYLQPMTPEVHVVG